MEHTKESRVEVIVRDSNVDVLFTTWKCFDKCASVLEVEALAYTKGLRWAHHWEFTQIILDSDYARITSSMMSNALDKLEVDPIIEEARS